MTEQNHFAASVCSLCGDVLLRSYLEICQMSSAQCLQFFCTSDPKTHTNTLTCTVFLCLLRPQKADSL